MNDVRRAAKSDDALRLVGIRKRYSRRGPWALDGLTCRFPRGSVCGLVGPNGAGKTTLYSVVCGFLPVDEGGVDLLGEGPFDPWKLKGRVGVLPQDAAIDDRRTCREFLHYMGALQGLGSSSKAAADDALKAVLLHERADDRAGSLSHGMRRRLSVASALLGSPELVLLDEPTAGLDPVQARSLRQVLADYRGRATIIVSSHNLTELERICDWVVLIEKGVCVREGPVDEVTGQRQVIDWLVGPGQPPLDALREALPGHDWTWAPADGSGVLTLRAPADANLDSSSIIAARLLADAGIAIRNLQRGRSLEETFFKTEPGALP
jgi:ABC-2 type transport system ATP-binding protein